MGFRQRQRFPLKPGLTTALCGLMAVGGLPALIGHDGAISAQAQAGGMDASAGRPVDISIVNGDLAMVIKLLQQQTGMEVLLQDAGRPFGKVSVTLTHASPMKALRTIAASANATISKNEDGVYVLRAGGGGNDAADVAPMQPAFPANPAPAAPAPLANTSLHKIVLQHAKPSDVMKIMHWDQYYTEINPYHNNNLETFHPDITTTGGNYLLNPNSVNNNGYNNSNDSAPSVPIGQGNQGGMVANRTADPSDQAQQFPGGGFGGQGGFGGGRGGRGGFGGQQGGFGGQNGGFGGQNGNQQQLPEGVDRIYALEGDNSLLVEATTDGYNKIKQIIQNLDISPRQVQIKVEFVTASIADVDAFGINFSLIPHPGVSVSNNQGSSAQFSPQTDIQYAVGNLVAEMFNSLTHNRGKVVQAPLITTTNNVPATLQINTQIPYVTTTNVVGGSGNVVSNTQQNFIAVTTQLTVSPRINADDTVTLQLQPQISDTSGQPATAGGAPPITTQALQTLRTVRSGDTMVLGGFVRKSDTHQQNKIPILGDLPIIGNLFRSRFNNNVDSELLIFVTPTIIDDGGESLSSSAGPNVSVAP